MNDTIVLGGDCSLELIQDGSADIFLPLKPATYTGPYAVTPTKQTQTLATADTAVPEDITVEPIPAEYIDPSGSVTLTSNGSHNVREYASAEVAVPLPEIYTGASTVTPTKQTQTLQTAGKELANNITVNPIPGAYIIPEGSTTIEENGTFDVAQFAQAVVNVASGGGGLEYESGIWTPAADENSTGHIPLSDTHQTWPSMYAVWIDGGAWPTQTSTAIGAFFIDLRKVFGWNVHQSASVTACGIARGYGISSNLSGNIGTSVCWPKSYQDGQNVDFIGFFASASELRPYYSNRNWRAGTSYKWVAIWL